MQGTESAGPRPSSSGQDPYKVSREAENKVVYKLSLVGLEKCRPLVDTFNLCMKGRSFTQIMCKREYNASQDCMHRYVNAENIELVKRRWVDNGKERHPDWNQLLAGVEERAEKMQQ